MNKPKLHLDPDCWHIPAACASAVGGGFLLGGNSKRRDIPAGGSAGGDCFALIRPGAAAGFAPLLWGQGRTGRDAVSAAQPAGRDLHPHFPPRGAQTLDPRTHNGTQLHHCELCAVTRL